MLNYQYNEDCDSLTDEAGDNPVLCLMASFVQDLKTNLGYEETLVSEEYEERRIDIIATLPVYCDTRLIDEEMDL